MKYGSLAKKFMRAYYGLDTWHEFWLLRWERIARIFNDYTEYYFNEHRRRLKETFITDGCIKIKDVKLPLLDEEHENMLFNFIFDDTFASYYYFDDRYDEKILRIYDQILDKNEGPYGCINDKVNVRVNPGDIVIDAGSWIGDFAAYASVKGGATYAFEPSEQNFKYLQQTAELNKNIFPIKKGLSDKNTTLKLFIDIGENSGGDSLMDKSDNKNFIESQDVVETITLDDFVKENNLERVDFIKADIEGFERNMLKGAQETLKNFAPKLALCTYHLPDDPEVMKDLIMQANPKYKIVFGKKKLYASV